MGDVITIGLDIAKSVFQIHGVDRDGEAAIRKRVSRAKLLEFFARLPPCVVGIEALSDRTSLGPKDSGAWSHSETDAPELCVELEGFEADGPSEGGAAFRGLLSVCMPKRKGQRRWCPHDSVRSVDADPSARRPATWAGLSRQNRTGKITPT
jgi:hypothetical protein